MDQQSHNQAQLQAECRTVLLACDEFSTDNKLRTFFSIYPLSVYQGREPQGNTPGERVDALLAAFGTRTFHNEPVLALILETLRGRRPVGDSERAALDGLATRVRVSMNQAASAQQPALPQASAPAVTPQALQPTTLPALSGAAHPDMRRNNARLLFSHLIEIDFKEQAVLIEQGLNKNVAAFLVYGPASNYGQEVLVQRIFATWKVLDSSYVADKVRYISIDVGSPKISYDVNRTLVELHKMVSAGALPTDNEVAEQVVEKVFNAWQKQDVVLIFRGIEDMVIEDMVGGQPQTALGKLLTRFWRVLADRALQVAGTTGPAASPTKRLILLLVAKNDRVSRTTDVRLAVQRDDPDYPLIPLGLLTASKFNKDLIQEWLAQLPLLTVFEQLAPGKPRLTTELLLENKEEDVPYRIFALICEHCGFELDDILKIADPSSSA